MHHRCENLAWSICPEGKDWLLKVVPRARQCKNWALPQARGLRMKLRRRRLHSSSWVSHCLCHLQQAERRARDDERARQTGLTDTNIYSFWKGKQTITLRSGAWARPDGNTVTHTLQCETSFFWRERVSHASKNSLDKKGQVATLTTLAKGHSSWNCRLSYRKEQDIREKKGSLNTSASSATAVPSLNLIPYPLSRGGSSSRTCIAGQKNCFCRTPNPGLVEQ